MQGERVLLVGNEYYTRMAQRILGSLWGSVEVRNWEGDWRRKLRDLESLVTIVAPSGIMVEIRNRRDYNEFNRIAPTVPRVAILEKNIPVGLMLELTINAMVKGFETVHNGSVEHRLRTGSACLDSSLRMRQRRLKIS